VGSGTVPTSTAVIDGVAHGSRASSPEFASNYRDRPRGPPLANAHISRWDTKALEARSSLDRRGGLTTTDRPPLLDRRFLQGPEDQFRTRDTLEFNWPDLLEPDVFPSAGRLHDTLATRTSPGPAIDAIRAAMITASP
jgi:hypothetical protein